MPCKHCLLPISAKLNSEFCCLGCETAYRLIQESGLHDYYELREQDIENFQALEREGNSNYTLMDEKNFHQKYVKTQTDLNLKTSILVEGIHCGACIWLLEKYLKQQKGIRNVSMNFAARELHIVWTNNEIQLSKIYTSIEKIGYKPFPFDQKTSLQRKRKEFRSLISKLAIAGFCAGNVMMLSVSLYTGMFHSSERAFQLLFEWASFFLTLPAFFYSAIPFWKGSLQAFKLRQPNMDTLISLGILITFFHSIFALVTRVGDTYFDSTTMLIFFLLIGRIIDFSMQKKIFESVIHLKSLLPSFSNKKIGEGEFAIVPTESIEVHDILKIHTGDVIPVDAIVIEGESKIEDSMLTGEQNLKRVQKGSRVQAGTLNKGNPFFVEVLKTSQKTMAFQLQETVESLTSQKMNFQKVADKVASWFVWIVLIVAAVNFSYWFFFFPSENYEYWTRTVSILIIACPCALGLATPTAISASTTSALKKGWVFKTTQALESAWKISKIIFDKTGTLTTDQIYIKKEVIFSKDPNFFAYVESIESLSNHPIAKTIVEYLKDKKLKNLQVDNFQNVAGLGIKGRVARHDVMIGNLNFLTQNGIYLEKLKKNEYSSLTQIYVAIDGELSGYFELEFVLKKGTKDLVQELYSMNIEPYILSGDTQKAVDQVSKELKIKHAYGGLLPNQKQEFIKNLQQQNEYVAMAGDGLNDGPALGTADLGIAVSNATDLSKIASDVIMLNPNLKSVIQLLKHTQMTSRVIYQNFSLSFIYNIITIPLAILGFFTPLYSALAMTGSSLVVVLNSLRLLRK